MYVYWLSHLPSAGVCVGKEEGTTKLASATKPYPSAGFCPKVVPPITAHLLVRKIRVQQALNLRQNARDLENKKKRPTQNSGP